MLAESSARARGAAIELRRNPLRRGATHCGGLHARVAFAIWPDKTAEHWAAASGRSVRLAQYWLAGGLVSAAGKLAIIRALD